MSLWRAGEMLNQAKPFEASVDAKGMADGAGLVAELALGLFMRAVVHFVGGCGASTGLAGWFESWKMQLQSQSQLGKPVPFKEREYPDLRDLAGAISNYSNRIRS